MAVVNSSKMNFRDTIMDILEKDYYRDGVVETVTEVIPQVAKEAAQKLRKESPKGDGPKAGTYAKGWTHSVEKGRLHVGATVYGKSGTYQLAHLLEHGHALRQGGRSPAEPHIQIVEEWAINEAYDRIMDKLERLP